MALNPKGDLGPHDMPRCRSLCLIHPPKPSISEITAARSALDSWKKPSNYWIKATWNRKGFEHGSWFDHFRSLSSLAMLKSGCVSTWTQSFLHWWSNVSQSFITPPWTQSEPAHVDASCSPNHSLSGYLATRKTVGVVTTWKLPGHQRKLHFQLHSQALNALLLTKHLERNATSFCNHLHHIAPVYFNLTHSESASFFKTSWNSDFISSVFWFHRPWFDSLSTKKDNSHLRQSPQLLQHLQGLQPLHQRHLSRCLATPVWAIRRRLSQRYSEEQRICSRDLTCKSTPKEKKLGKNIQTVAAEYEGKQSSHRWSALQPPWLLQRLSTRMETMATNRSLPTTTTTTIIQYVNTMCDIVWS